MNDALPIMLSGAVPLHIMQLEIRGGPIEDDFNRVRACSQVLAEKADVLMFGSKVKGEAASLFNRLADALAVMAFVPGGVHFHGMHFQSTMKVDLPKSLPRLPIRLRIRRRLIKRRGSK